MKVKICFLFCAFIFARALYPQNAFPSLDPDGAAFSYAERLSRPRASSDYWRALAESALWASSLYADGASAINGNFKKIDDAVRSLRASLPRGEKEKAEYVLQFMYANLLTGYVEMQTRLDELLRTGRYNCVSSAALYMILGRAVGLDVGAVMTRDHAFGTVNIGGEIIDVETTNAYGFDPGNRKEFHDNFGMATGFAYVPAQNYRERAAITPAELVSLILSNRIAELEKCGVSASPDRAEACFSEAVRLAVSRAALLSRDAPAGDNKFFERPYADVLNRIFNYGALFVNAGREDEALAWAEYAASRFPATTAAEEKRWNDFWYAAVNNKITKLLNTETEGSIDEARAVVNNKRNAVGSENAKLLDKMISQAELNEKMNAALFEIQEWGAAGDWLSGMEAADRAIKEFGAEAQFVNAKKVFRQNRIGDLHNAFAALYNGGDYAGAKAALEKALAEFPGEKIFRDDKAVLEKTIK
jgi:hypothetical protein